MSQDNARETREIVRRLLANQPEEDLARAFLSALPEEKLTSFIDFIIHFLLPRNHGSIYWGDRLLTLDKTAGFLEDPLFAAAMREIHGSHTYDAYDSPQGIGWRIHTLCWAGRRALALPLGDFVECGVFKGDMAWCVSRFCDLEASDRRFFLYDSFQGFDPRLSGETEIPKTPDYFDFANRYYQRAGIREYVESRFDDNPRVEVFAGILPDAFDVAPPPDAIAYLHIDLNSPTAELACMERLFDKVVPGGSIVLDDYGWKVFRKQKEVADEFFAGRGQQILELPTGQGLVVKH